MYLLNQVLEYNFVGVLVLSNWIQCFSRDLNGVTWDGTEEQPTGVEDTVKSQLRCKGKS